MTRRSKWITWHWTGRAHCQRFATGPPWETADPIFSAKEAKDRLREIYAPLSQAGPGNDINTDINTGSTLAAVRGFTKSHEPL
jgi:hypothetical protein